MKPKGNRKVNVKAVTRKRLPKSITVCLSLLTWHLLQITRWYRAGTLQWKSRNIVGFSVITWYGSLTEIFLWHKSHCNSSIKIMRLQLISLEINPKKSFFYNDFAPLRNPTLSFSYTQSKTSLLLYHIQLKLNWFSALIDEILHIFYYFLY